MNSEFQHATRKFRQPVPIDLGGDEVADTPIDDQRKLQIEAAVTELQDMPIDMLSVYFTVQPKMVKARVEDLIDLRVQLNRSHRFASTPLERWRSFAQEVLSSPTVRNTTAAADCSS